MSEKRFFERAEFDGTATLEWGAKRSSARIRDLSVGGAYVVSAEKPGFGTAVTLVLQLPALAAKGPSRIQGVVRWVRDDGFGVQFGPTGALDTFGLAEYVVRATKQI